MKTAYPVIFTDTGKGYVASVPDMEIDTQGDTLADAIAMARDAIGIMGIDMEDDGKQLPAPSDLAAVRHDAGEIVSMVDIDFDAYRRANDRRTVRTNVSLPSWLKVKAEEAGVNFSAVLQSALKQELNLR